MLNTFPIIQIMTNWKTSLMASHFYSSKAVFWLKQSRLKIVQMCHEGIPQYGFGWFA